MTDRRPLTLRTDVTPNRLQELPAGDQLPPDTLANALAVVLQGLVTNNNAGITAADTVLQALGKLQAQSTNKVDKDGSKVLSDNNYTNAERVKLANIGDSESHDRSKHTGTQPLSTITGIVGVGGVIERGSNSNGDYSKFADGMLICTQRIVCGFDTANTLKGIWNFPVFFSRNARISAQIVEGGAAIYKPLNIITYGQSTGVVGFLVYVPEGGIGASDVVNLDLTAAGYWS